MKLIKIKKEKIIKIINIINLIIEKKINNKNLNNFIIITKKNFIFFLINNIYTQIKIKIKTKKIIKKNISIKIDLKKIFKILKSFKKYKIKIFLKKNKIIFKQKNIKYEIKTIKINNYNLINFKKKNILKIEIEKNEINNIIKTIFFIINKNSNLNTLFKIKKNYIKVISTDNYRIIYDKIYIKKEINITKNIILNNKILLIIYKILKNTKNNKNIKISINKLQIKIKFKNLEIISNIILKKFPILKWSIKKKYNNNFTVNKENLLSSIKRCIIITDKKNNFSKWIIKENLLTINTKSNSQEIGKELIKINYNNKNNLTMYIDNNHILDLLNNINSKELIFNFSLKNKNIIILIPNKENFKYVITQINI